MGDVVAFPKKKGRKVLPPPPPIRFYIYLDCDIPYGESQDGYMDDMLHDVVEAIMDKRGVVRVSCDFVEEEGEA